MARLEGSSISDATQATDCLWNQAELKKPQDQQGGGAPAWGCKEEPPPRTERAATSPVQPPTWLRSQPWWNQKEDRRCDWRRARKMRRTGNPGQTETALPTAANTVQRSQGSRASSFGKLKPTMWTSSLWQTLMKVFFPLLWVIDMLILCLVMVLDLRPLFPVTNCDASGYDWWQPVKACGGGCVYALLSSTFQRRKRHVNCSNYDMAFQ